MQPPELSPLGVLPAFFPGLRRGPAGWTRVAGSWLLVRELRMPSQCNPFPWLPESCLLTPPVLCYQTQGGLAFPSPAPLHPAPCLLVLSIRSDAPECRPHILGMLPTFSATASTECPHMAGHRPCPGSTSSLHAGAALICLALRLITQPVISTAPGTQSSSHKHHTIRTLQGRSPSLQKPRLSVCLSARSGRQ